MENMEDFCVSHHPKRASPPAPAAEAVAAAKHTYSSAAAAAAAVAAISLKSHTEHATNKNKTKHIMKISQINVCIYGNYGRKVRWIVKRFGKYRRKLWKDI